MEALKQGLRYVLPDIGTDGLIWVLTTALSRSMNEEALAALSYAAGIILFYGGAATMCYVAGARSWL